MIRLQNLTLQRGPQRLLEDAELTLHAGQLMQAMQQMGSGLSGIVSGLQEIGRAHV